MFNKKNVDYVALLWEDFMYQADNREISSERKAYMPYLRFSKFIINHFIFKEKTISMRNKINIHIIRDDPLLGDGVGSQPKVPDESQDKTTGIDEGTGAKPRVPNVPKYLSECKNC
nr:hypothetical protein [Tanacetum cinerariifolium]